MADYYQLKNQNIFNPPANTSLGNSTNQFGNAFVQNDLVLGNVTVTGATIVTPKVSTIGYPGDDTAADPAGGQTITLTGSGFLVGASVLINGSAVGVVSVVSSTTITFTSPANSAGSYVLYVINTDGGTAIAIPGIQYSGVPTWTTAAGSLGSLYETASFNQSVTATGDAPITYSLFSGSIPPGATFNSNGTITGTSELLSSSTTYTFTVRATDAEAQDTNRSFSLTINPDVVTWSSPANGTTYTSTANSAISNVTLVATSAVGSGITYTANALPVGLSLTGANISGTPTVEANSSSLLTATANTTSESSSITINWVIGVANDIFFEYNTLLIPGASTTFVDDASTNNFAVSIFGDTKPNSFNPYTPGYYSNYFDGNLDYLSASATTLPVGSANYTIECWFNGSSASKQTIVYWGTGSSNQSMGFTINANGSVFNWWFSNDLTTTGVNVLDNAWHHLVATFNGTVRKIYVDGIQRASDNPVGKNTVGTNVAIGYQPGIGGESNYMFGYISNLRVVAGLVYDVSGSTITVPTTPLTAISNTSLLTCQSNRFIDNSTNNFTLTVNGNTSISSFDPFVPNSNYSTYGSGYFDGTGDYLSIPNNVALQLTANFTIEFYIYATILFGRIIVKGNNAGNDYSIDLNSNGTFGFNNSNGVATSTGSITVNSWNHFALTRNGSSCTWWINGVSSGTFTYSNSLNNTNAFWIGQNQNSGLNFQGYLTDVRVVKDTAVYTTSFTPPSAPLTAIANTSLLTLQNNQAVNNNVFLDNSTNNFLVTRAGNATQGTFSPYGGNWSNYFDGTGDFLTASAVTGFSTTGNVTLECWAYVTSASNYGGLAGMRNADGGGGLSINILNTGYLEWALSSYNGSEYYAGTLCPLNQWFHVALVRSGSSANNCSCYLNGTRVGQFSSNAEANATNVFIIGRYYSTGTSQYFLNGYVSNMRYVKGTALYSGTTYTVPTTPLTPITNTVLLTCADSRFVDDSINNFTITRNGDTSVQRFSPFNPSSVTPTSYSGYFDGSGDYLNTSSATFSTTGDLTLECWAYVTSASNYAGLVSLRASANASGMAIDIGNTGYLEYVLNTDGGSSLYTGTLCPLNQWFHVALVRSGSSANNCSCYLNGTRVAQFSSNYEANGASNALVIGRYYADGASQYFLNGYVSNVRYVKGTAVYSGATITVPTSPLTAIANTVLLTCQSTTFIDNSTNNFTITAVGNSQPTQQNPFGFTSALTNGYTPAVYGGSMFSDGTLDYLSVTNSNNSLAFGTNDYTIEMWVYLRSYAQSSFWECNPFGTTGSRPNGFIWYQATGVVYVFMNGANFLVSSSNVIPLMQWTHIALVRKSGATGFYVNGVNVAAASTSYNSTQNAGIIGAFCDGGSYSIDGYVSDVRAINGNAVYTSNFAPPPSPLTPIQNSSLLLSMTSAGIYDAAMMNNMETVGNAQLSTAISKFGGSSMSFDGTGDYLSMPTNQMYAFGTGDFTIEGWLYFTGNQNFGPMFISSTTGAGNALHIQINNANKVRVTNETTEFLLATNAISLSTWTHIAVVRSGTTLSIYQNGTLNGSTTNSTNFIQNGALVGLEPTGGSFYYAGYIDDLRITKGVARYTSNFTPATSAFPIF